MERPIKFESFFTASLELLKVILINPFKPNGHSQPLRDVQSSILFWLSICTSVLVFVQQSLYVYVLVQQTNDVAQIISSGAWIPASLICLECNLFLWRFGERCTRLVIVLETTFPTSQENHGVAAVHETSAKWNRMSWFICRAYLLAVIMIYWKNVSLAVYGYVLHDTWELEMPRMLWYPFDPRGSYWLQVAVYTWECWGTLTTTQLVVAITMFLGSITMHICIQLDVLCRRFLELCPRRANVAGDLEKLHSLVRQHNHLLSVCDELGSIFKDSLLVNYALISVSIGCFGFLALNESEIFKFVEYILYLICLMSYNSLFSYYGDSLMVRVSMWLIRLYLMV